MIRNKINMFDVDEQLDAAFGKEGTLEREAAEKKATMTQTELAKKIGTDRTYISRVETGEIDLIGKKLNINPNNCTTNRTVEVIVEQSGDNLSAYIEGAPIITVGDDMKEIEMNMKEAIEFYLEDDNTNPVDILTGDFDLEFKLTQP